MSLPKPYYNDERSGIKIYFGDCREILPTLPKADLILTDPPYGLGERWTGGTWGSATMYEDARKWDVKISDKDMEIILSYGKDAIIWGGNYPYLGIIRLSLWDKIAAGINQYG